MPTPPAARARMVHVALLLVVAAGIVARFATRSPLWLDEALSSNIASLPLGDIPEALRQDGHPPLYYWLLHVWQDLFGTGDLAVRSLSGIFGVLCLPLMWAAASRTAGATAGAWALAVLAVTPFAVRYSTEARMYSLVMLLVLVGYLVLGAARRAPTWPRLAGLALVVALLLWTHYWSLYLVASLGVVLVWTWWRRPPVRATTTKIVVAVGVGCVLFLPWVPSLLEQAEHTGTPWAEPSRPSQVLQITLTDLGGGGWSEATLFGIAAVVAIVVALFAVPAAEDVGLVRLGERPQPLVVREMAVVALTLGIGSVAALVTGAGFASRYSAVVVPLLLIGVGAGLALLRRGWLLVGLAASLALFGSVGIAKNVLDDRTQAEDLVAILEVEAQPEDVVVVCPDQLGPSLERALRGADGPDQVVPYPLAGDPRLVDWRDYEERNDAASPQDFAADVRADAGDATIWMVFNTTYRTLEGDCEELSRALGAGREVTTFATPSDAFEPAYLVRYR